MSNKLLRLAIATCLLCLPFAVCGQNISVEGLVTLQNSNNTPVKGAQVKALWATPKVTDNEGEFRLVFIDKKPADEVQLEIIFRGYEVVNKKELNLLLNPDRLSRFYMCKIGEWENNAITYYQLNRKKIFFAYQDRINRLSTKNFNLRDTIKSLEEQRDKAVQQVSELSEIFAKANLDDASDLFKDAHTAFTNGDIEKALKILSIDNMRARITEAKTLKEKGEELIKIGKQKVQQADIAVNDYIQLTLTAAKMAAALSKIEEAKSYYRLALDYDSNSVDILESYALFLIEQRDPERLAVAQKTILMFTGIMDALQTQPLTDAIFEKLVLTNSSISIIRSRLGEYDTIRKSYEALLIKYQSLPSPGAEALMYYARCLSSLAAFTMMDEDFFARSLDKAKQQELRKTASGYYKQAWRIIDSLSGTTSGSDVDKVSILQNMATYNLVSGYPADAILQFKAMIGILRIRGSDSLKTQLDIAGAYANIYDAYNVMEKRDSAIIYLNFSDTILSRLMKKDSISAKAPLLSNHARRSSYHKYTGNQQQELISRKDYVAAYETLCKSNYNRFALDLAEAYEELGDFYMRTKSDTEAIKAYTVAEGIYRQFSSSRSLSGVLNSKGLEFQRNGQMDSTLIYYRQAIRELEQKPSLTKDSVYDLQNIARISNNIAGIYEMRQQYRSAISPYLKSLKIYQTLLPLDPSNWRKYIALVCDRLSDCYRGAAEKNMSSVGRLEAYDSCRLYQQYAYDLDSLPARLTKMSITYYFQVAVITQFESAHPDAIPYLIKGIKIMSDNPDTSELADKVTMTMYYQLALIRLNLCRYDSALVTARMAAQKLANDDFIMLQLVALHLLSKQNEFRKVLAAWKVSDKVKSDTFLDLWGKLQETECIRGRMEETKRFFIQLFGESSG